MNLWATIVWLVGLPGRFAVARLPKMDPEATRLAAHMVNYIVWLTPIVGFLIYLVIRQSIARYGGA